LHTIRWRRPVAVFAVTRTVGDGAPIRPGSADPDGRPSRGPRTAVTGAAISTLEGAFAALPVGQILDRFGRRLLISVPGVWTAGQR
jgi:hypothetical protein